MADDVKRQMHKRCDVGGIYCDCCNPYYGKDKKILSRMVRRTQKHKLQNRRIKNELEIPR